MFSNGKSTKMLSNLKSQSLKMLDQVAIITYTKAKDFGGMWFNQNEASLFYFFFIFLLHKWNRSLLFCIPHVLTLDIALSLSEGYWPGCHRLYFFIKLDSVLWQGGSWWASIHSQKYSYYNHTPTLALQHIIISYKKALNVIFLISLQKNCHTGFPAVDTGQPVSLTASVGTY